MYTNIMFDLDGTVTDSGKAIMSSVEYALSQFGIIDQPREKLQTFIGPSLYDSFEREYGMTGEDCDKAVSLYRSIYEKERMYDVDIYDGMPELLDELIDRFGDPPESVKNLLMVARLKFMSKALGIQSIVERGDQLEMQLGNSFSSKGMIKLLQVFKGRIDLLTEKNLIRLRPLDNKKLNAAMKAIEILSSQPKR